MTGWAAWALERARRGEAVALVTVCAVQGSAPRDSGTRMVVTATETFATIGGGALEHQAISQARAMLAKGAGHAFQDWPLGPLLAQCCGGHVRLLLERVVSTGWLEQAAAFQASGEPFLIRTDLPEAGLVKTVRRDVGQSEAVRFLGRDGGFLGAARPPLAEIGAVIEREAAGDPPLLLFGAGHVGQAMAPILRTLPFALRWLDPRPDMADGVEALDEAALLDAVAAAPAGAFFLILTHSHALDYDLTRAVLRRGDFRYCGLIGSDTKRARFTRRLLADGLPATALDRLTCPIGLPSLKGKAPPVIAIAAAAQLLERLQAHHLLKETV